MTAVRSQLLQSGDGEWSKKGVQGGTGENIHALLNVRKLVKDGQTRAFNRTSGKVFLEEEGEL